jgi:hypothetical protein
MIVLSILTALGFERAAVYMHDRATARQSRARIEREIATDLTDVRKAVTANGANVAAIRTSLKAMVLDLKSARPDTAKEKQIFDDVLQHHFSLEFPAWQRDAWDAAVADQSASHLDPADLRHYAELYTDARDAADASHILLTGGIFDRISDLSLQSQLGDVDGREAARLMLRFLITAQQVTAIQQTLLASAGAGSK